MFIELAHDSLRDELLRLWLCSGGAVDGDMCVNSLARWRLPGSDAQAPNCSTCSSLGLFLQGQGLLEQASPLLHLCVPLADDEAAVAPLFSRLGALFLAAADFESATALYQAALCSNGERQGYGSAAALAAMPELALAMWQRDGVGLGDRERALQIAEQAVRESKGAGNACAAPAMARALLVCGWLKNLSGGGDEGHALVFEAMDLRQGAFGPTSGPVLECLKVLSALRYEQGAHEEVGQMLGVTRDILQEMCIGNGDKAEPAAEQLEAQYAECMHHIAALESKGGGAGAGATDLDAPMVPPSPLKASPRGSKSSSKKSPRKQNKPPQVEDPDGHFRTLSASIVGALAGCVIACPLEVHWRPSISSGAAGDIWEWRVAGKYQHSPFEPASAETVALYEAFDIAELEVLQATDGVDHESTKRWLGRYDGSLTWVAAAAAPPASPVRISRQSSHLRSPQKSRPN